jgi:MFS transporter, MHS family, proline/betaine transporter
MGSGGKRSLQFTPVFKRFTCATMTFAVSRTLMFVVTSFGFVYFIDYFGNWGL